MIRIRKGLDLPIQGGPAGGDDSNGAASGTATGNTGAGNTASGNVVRHVALLGDDYIGMRPTMEVREGDTVKLGQLVFTDKKTEGVRYTAPGAGVVKAVNRGDKRKFLSLVIELSGDAEETFVSYGENEIGSVPRDEVKRNLVHSGMWSALRRRPYSKVPAPSNTPRSIFVTAIDTNPLAADPAPIIAKQQKNFVTGLRVLGRLTDGKVFLCKKPGAAIPGGELDFVRVEEFAGPHPAGLAGTHIHFLDPVSATRFVWYVNYQDVIALGHLFLTGRILVDRVVSLGGPVVKNPRLVRTRLGANLTELMKGELETGDNRVISGSVLSGRKAAEPIDFLGRYHLQVSALSEGRRREFLGWQKPGFDKFSVKNVFASALQRGSKRFSFTTSTEGSRRSIVPIGMYEKVMPLDIVATSLLKSLIVEDTEEAQLLGALELDEEDLALCTFVCPGKYDYGPILRRNLSRIEREG